MGQIQVNKDIGGIKGICVITPSVHGNNREYFMETYSQHDMEAIGIDYVSVQNDQWLSSKSVFRGLHFQKQYPQVKLVRVIKGFAFDVIVDLKKDSKIYCYWHGELLPEVNKQQFLVSHGFAYSFLVVSDIAEFGYKCDDFYYPNDEDGMAWNDPERGIVRPKVASEYKGVASAGGYSLKGVSLKLSDKDEKWLGIRDIFKFC